MSYTHAKRPNRDVLSNCWLGRCLSNIRLAASLLLIVTIFTPASFAQEIVIDWRDRNYNVLQRPAQVSKGESVKVSLQGINDILYDYTVNVSLVLEPHGDDFALLSGLLRTGVPKGPEEATPPKAGTCEGAINKLGEEIANINGILQDPNNHINPEYPTGTYNSINVDQTLDSWHHKVEPELSKLPQLVAAAQGYPNDQTCTNFLKDKYTPIEAKISEFRKRVNSTHTKEAASTVAGGPVAKVQINVREIYRDKEGHEHVVREHTYVLDFSSVLTVSAGVLFTTLEDRAYVRRKIPTDSTPIDVLGVDSGSRPVPMLVGLLNYKPPWGDWERWGFSVSSGPVIRLGGSKSAVSNFGYFLGASIHLWHRFFVTPGIHVGQFADFPQGFFPGKAIPSNFGELTPLKRWTARFGIAVTYKTYDLSSLSGQKRGQPKEGKKKKEANSGPAKRQKGK